MLLVCPCGEDCTACCQGEAHRGRTRSRSVAVTRARGWPRVSLSGRPEPVCARPVCEQRPVDGRCGWTGQRFLQMCRCVLEPLGQGCAQVTVCVGDTGGVHCVPPCVGDMTVCFMGLFEPVYEGTG